MVVKDAQEVILKEARYTYDVFDRRLGVWEDDDGDGVGVQRWTVYDGDNPWADFDGAGSLTSRYLYGPALDQLFARMDAEGDVDWYLGDYLGSVRQIVKTDGTVLNNIDYDSFGQILNETHPENGDRFKFTAREWDGLLGQYYYRARYYGPDVGRFYSEDPIGFAAGDTNLYRYVFNSPINATDATGLFIEIGFTWPLNFPIGVTGGVRIDTTRWFPIRPFVGIGFGNENARILVVDGPARSGLHVQGCFFLPPVAGPFGRPPGWPAWLPFPRFISPGGGFQRALFPGPIGPIDPMGGMGSPGWFAGFIWVF